MSQVAFRGRESGPQVRAAKRDGSCTMSRFTAGVLNASKPWIKHGQETGGLENMSGSSLSRRWSHIPLPVNNAVDPFSVFKRPQQGNYCHFRASKFYGRKCPYGRVSFLLVTILALVRGPTAFTRKHPLWDMQEIQPPF